MSDLLERAFAKASTLPEAEQDSLGAIILDVLDDEAQWSAQFAASQGALATMAQEALEEYRAGKTLPLDPETL